MFEKEKDRTQRKDFIFVSARVSMGSDWAIAATGAPSGWEDTVQVGGASDWAEAASSDSSQVCMLVNQRRDPPAQYLPPSRTSPWMGLPGRS